MHDTTIQTLAKIKKICQERKISGVYGVLIDLLEEIPSKYRLVIELALKKKLFSLIVENE